MSMPNSAPANASDEPHCPGAGLGGDLLDAGLLVVPGLRHGRVGLASPPARRPRTCSRCAPGCRAPFRGGARGTAATDARGGRSRAPARDRHLALGAHLLQDEFHPEQRRQVVGPTGCSVRVQHRRAGRQVGRDVVPVARHLALVERVLGGLAHDSSVVVGTAARRRAASGDLATSPAATAACNRAFRSVARTTEIANRETICTMAFSPASPASSLALPELRVLPVADLLLHERHDARNAKIRSCSAWPTSRCHAIRRSSLRSARRRPALRRPGRRETASRRSNAWACPPPSLRRWSPYGSGADVVLATKTTTRRRRPDAHSPWADPPGVAVEPADGAHARAQLARREAIAASPFRRRPLHGARRGTLHERVAPNGWSALSQQWQVSFVSATTGSTRCCGSTTRVTALVLFTRHDPSEIVRTRRAGITRHVIARTALRLDLPLAVLAGPRGREERFDEWIRARSRTARCATTRNRRSSSSTNSARMLRRRLTGAGLSASRCLVSRLSSGRRQPCAAFRRRRADSVQALVIYRSSGVS